MQEAESKAKAQLKYNKCKFGIQIILLGTIAFCVLDHGILNEVKYVLDVLNLKNPERIITQVILPLKTFYDLSQIYSVGTFIFDVIIFPKLTWKTLKETSMKIAFGTITFIYFASLIMIIVINFVIFKFNVPNISLIEYEPKLGLEIWSRNNTTK